MEGTITSISELAVNHSYYCSDNNYLSNTVGSKYETGEEFLKDWGDMDIDYNLLFRWDVKVREEVYKEDDDFEMGTYWMELFFMLQRKGHFVPVYIENVYNDDVKSILEFLTPRMNYMKNLWEPLFDKK